MLVYVATEVATIKTCNCDWGDTTTDEKYMQNVDVSTEAEGPLSLVIATYVTTKLSLLSERRSSCYIFM